MNPLLFAKISTGGWVLIVLFTILAIPAVWALSKPWKKKREPKSSKTIGPAQKGAAPARAALKQGPPIIRDTHLPAKHPARVSTPVPPPPQVSKTAVTEIVAVWLEPNPEPPTGEPQLPAAVE